MQPSCDSQFSKTWSLVNGATPEEQWPVSCPPMEGWQISSDDSQAVTSSAVGSRYKFVQPISVYGPIETIRFRVRCKISDGTYKRLKDYLSDRGTVKTIKATMPGTDVQKWRRVAAQEFEHQGGGVYEVPVTLEQNHNPG